LASEQVVSTPLLVTLAVAPNDLISGKDQAALTEIEAAKEISPVAASPVAGSDTQPIEAPGGGGMLVGPELVYFTTDKLSKSPEVIAMDDLNTPETRIYKVSGSLVMNLWIDDRGKVSKVSVEDSALPPIFAETAIRVFKAARFSPGERDGVRVGTLMRIEVGYEDKGLPVAH
jgi:protein TonB